MAHAHLSSRARPTHAARRAGALLLAASCALSAACSPFGGGDDAAAADPPLSTAAPVTAQASVVGSGPQPSPPAPVPAATVTQDTTSFVTVTQPAPPVAAQDDQEGEMCADLVSRSVVGVGVGAVASQGAVTLSWMSRKGASLEGWRIAAARQDLVSGTQPPLVWKDVPAPAGCQVATTTITGLASGGTYQFWLHTVLTDAEGGDPAVVMVGRSPVVAVP